MLRAKECIMRTVSVIQENAEDIYEEALEVNEKRAAEETEFEDESESHDDFQETPEEIIADTKKRSREN